MVQIVVFLVIFLEIQSLKTLAHIAFKLKPLYSKIVVSKNESKSQLFVLSINQNNGCIQRS